MQQNKRNTCELKAAELRLRTDVKTRTSAICSYVKTTEEKEEEVTVSLIAAKMTAMDAVV